MAADKEQFHQILTSLLSTDNNIRSQAEEAYSNLVIDSKVSHLIIAIQDGNLSEEARQMSAVLLRRIFSNDFLDFYPKLSPDNQLQLKQQVILAIQNEQQSVQLRNKVCEVAAEVARNLIDDDGNNQWPEFLQFLFQCANAPSPVHKEAALRLFASVPGVFGNQQNNYLDLIKQMLMSSLASSEPYDVRFQAVRAVGSFLIIHDKETQVLKHFNDVLLPMLMVVAESMQLQLDDTLLKLLIEMAETVPKFLRPQIVPVYEMCMKLFSDGSAIDSWRQLSLEVMVSLAEMAPAMVRKNAGKYIAQLVPVILQFMADIEEEEDWSKSDELLDEENDSNHVVAEAALDRLACGLGGKTILPLVTQQIPAMLAHPDWRQRYAALMALSAIGEGCHKQMEDMLGQIVNGVPGVMQGVLTYLQDPHPRVRYAACNAIGQMSTDFAPVLQKQFHATVVPTLCMLLEDNENPRVQAHAGAALVNFAEDCPKHILTGYLDTLMGKLEAILSSKFKELVEKGTKLVLEQVVTTIASVADTAEYEFIAYYDRLMPCLKYIILNANKDELKLLRGKTIECVTLIGVAVGSEKFQNDAREVMDMLLKTHGDGVDLPDDDPQTSYMISAWSRICKVLGRNFEPYLPLVMGPVMRTASMKPDIALLDNEDMQGVEGDEDWQFVSLGEQKNFGIRTAGLEDKAAACMMLVCYARELKEAFAKYAEETVKLMVPMLKFYFHDDVRNAAAESLPWLLESAAINGPAFVQAMWNYICPELLKALDTEPETEVMMILLDSMARCIEKLGIGCLDQDSMNELLKLIDKLMKEHFERATDRVSKVLDEDYDEIVQEQLEDEESDDIYLLSKISELIHALFISYREQFLPFFDQICNHFVALLEPNKAWADHQWGICVFDDLVEFTGPASAKYQGLFITAFHMYVKDKSSEVRQAAAYGWGVLAQMGPDEYVHELTKAVPSLVEIIQDPKSRDQRNINATENAISALTKIMKYKPAAITNVDELLPMWLSWLPVIEDADEAPHVYGYLCDLVEQNNPLILGAGNINIPRIIAIVAEAFFRDVMEPTKPEGVRMLNIVRQVQSNEALFQTVVQSLAAELQQALHNALHAKTQ